MDDSITIGHGLPYFCVTRDPYMVPTSSGETMYVTEGYIDYPLERYCSFCGELGYKHGFYERRIRDIELLGKMSLLKVRTTRMKCRFCSRTWGQRIPFADEDHLITVRFRKQLQEMINLGATLTSVSKRYGIHINTLYSMDRSFLKGVFDLKHPAPARYIGIDEFQVHEGHNYATVVINLEDGHIIFMEEGKKKEQAKHFFAFVGDEWMQGVLAVAMDMNAQYDSAFRECWPHVAIVYDFFHMVKLYNDTVITELRRRLQAECKERKDMDGYALLKNSRFLLLTDISKIKERDSEARENNNRLNAEYRLKGLPLPPGEKIQYSFRERKLKEILSKNEGLSVAYLLLEQLKLAYSCKSEAELRRGFLAWFKLAEQSGCPEIVKFKTTVERRLDGIVSHARFHISSGAVEGCNNVIKTVKKKAYGFNDTEYFFLKCMYESRKHRYSYKSHKTL